MTLLIDCGNDMYNDMIICVRMDPQLRLLQRVVESDFEARDAAITEVDRMHAEIDD